VTILGDHEEGRASRTSYREIMTFLPCNERRERCSEPVRHRRSVHVRQELHFDVTVIALEVSQRPRDIEEKWQGVARRLRRLLAKTRDGSKA